MSIQLRLLGWMLERVEAAVEEAINRTYARKLRASVDPGHGDDIEGIHSVFHKQVENELVTLLLPHVKHVPLPSSVKRSMLEHFIEHTILCTIDVDRLADAMDYTIEQQQLAQREFLSNDKVVSE